MYLKRWTATLHVILYDILQPNSLISALFIDDFLIYMKLTFYFNIVCTLNTQFEKYLIAAIKIETFSYDKIVEFATGKGRIELYAKLIYELSFKTINIITSR